MLLREAGSVHLIASMPPFAAAPVSAGGSDVMMDRHRIIQRAFNMRPHMVSISLAWAQRPRCASKSTVLADLGAAPARPGPTDGHVAAPKIEILRQVVVADTDEEALETTRAANEDWYHSITKLWHDRDDIRFTSARIGRPPRCPNADARRRSLTSTSDSPIGRGGDMPHIAGHDRSQLLLLPATLDDCAFFWCRSLVRLPIKFCLGLRDIHAELPRPARAGPARIATPVPPRAAEDSANM